MGAAGLFSRSTPPRTIRDKKTPAVGPGRTKLGLKQKKPVPGGFTFQPRREQSGHLSSPVVGKRTRRQRTAFGGKICDKRDDTSPRGPPSNHRPRTFSIYTGPRPSLRRVDFAGQGRAPGNTWTDCSGTPVLPAGASFNKCTGGSVRWSGHRPRHFAGLSVVPPSPFKPGRDPRAARASGQPGSR